MRAIAPLMLGTLAIGLSSYVFFGILPAAAHNLEVDLATAGQGVTAFTLAYAVLSPIGATLLAGRPARFVSMLALWVMVLGNIVGALAQSVPALLVGRVLAGAGSGMYMPVAVAAAAQLVAPQRRGRALALMLSGLSIAATVGASAADLIASHWGWRTTQWIVVLAVLTALASVRFGIPRLEPVAGPSLRARVAILADRRVLAIAVITLLSAATSIGTYTYLSAIIGHHGGGTSLGFYLLAWGAGGVSGSLGIGMVADRFADMKVMVTIILAAQGVLLLLLSTTSPALLGMFVLLFVWGGASWAAVVPQQHRLLDLVPASAPVAIGVNSASIYLGNALGAFTGGMILRFGWTVLVVPMVFGAAALAGAATNLRTTGAADDGAQPGT